jgi:hypothetical protein
VKAVTVPVAASMAAMIAVSLACDAVPLPSDQSLINRFKQDRAAFERVVEIARDKGQISPTSSDTTDARYYPEARKLMERIHVWHAFSFAGNVTFWATGPHHSLTGFAKGWKHTSQPPDSTKVVSSLDGTETSVEPYDIRYRSLGDGWYLFLQSNQD